MKSYKSAFIIIFAALIYIGNVWACKERETLDAYPVKEAIPSTTLVVAKVVEIIKRGDEHRSVVQFKIKVIKSYQGSLAAGDVVSVSESYGPAHGVCPVFVKKGHKYIMILWHIDGRYEISRFNYLVDSRAKNFQAYIQQLDRLYAK